MVTSRAQGFEPVADGDFIARRMTQEIATETSRDKARSGWRVFHARSGIDVAIQEGVVERMVAFGKRAEPNEWYALLVGRLFSDALGTHVTIDGAVFDAEAEATRGSINTTPTSELRTRQLAAFLYPDTQPIGWAHGHVQCGARYSNVDRRNQRSWTQPHSVGVVIDPWDPELLAIYLGPNSELLTPVSEAPKPTPLLPSGNIDQETRSETHRNGWKSRSNNTKGASQRALVWWGLGWSFPLFILTRTGIGYIDSLTQEVDELTGQLIALKQSSAALGSSTLVPPDTPVDSPEALTQSIAQGDVDELSELDATRMLLPSSTSPPTTSPEQRDEAPVARGKAKENAIAEFEVVPSLATAAASRLKRSVPLTPQPASSLMPKEPTSSEPPEPARNAKARSRINKRASRKDLP